MVSFSCIVTSVVQMTTFVLLVWWVAVIKISTSILTLIFGPEYKQSLFGKNIRSTDFSLDPSIVCINNGSYGTVPIVVKDAQQKLRDEMESCPDSWFLYKAETLWRNSIRKVANFINANPQNVVFVTNTTTAINTVLRSLDLKEGEGILITNQTYGAIHRTAREVCSVKNANLVVLNVTFQTSDLEGTSDFYAGDIAEQYRKVLQENPNIKLAIIDHITSCSAMLLPVRELIKVCREHSVMVLVDGAHAPGHVQLELNSLDADFYVGNIHKWLFSARGTAILWVHPKYHHLIHPIVVSWNHDFSFQKRFFSQGTQDLTAYLSVDAALQFYRELGGMQAIRSHNSALASWASLMLATEWKTEVLPVPESMRAPNMACIRLPPEFTSAYGATLEGEESSKKDLYERHSICVSVVCIQSSLWCRISANVYNAKTDYVKLADAVLRLKRALLDGYIPSVRKLGTNSQVPSRSPSSEIVTEEN